MKQHVDTAGKRVEAAGVFLRCLLEMARDLLTSVRSGDQASALYHLSRHGIDLNLADESGRTSIFYAASDPLMVLVLQKLLWLGADANAQNEHGTTPLHRY